MNTERLVEPGGAGLPRDGMRTLARRSLLARAGGLGLAVPFMIPVMDTLAEEHDHGHGSEETPSPDGDEADHDAEGAAEAQHTEAPVPSSPPQPFTVYDPFLPPVEPGAKRFEIVAHDATRYVAKNVPCATWTYDGSVPGRTLRVRQGDEVTVTFRVDPGANAHHSLDLHSAQTAPDKNFRTINAGEEMTWSFVARHAGAFMYHCGTPQVLMHIGAGMYGAMIVDPPEGWSPAQELVLVQSDLYLKEGENGARVPDYERMLGGGAMDYVVFNGYANQYVEHPIQVKVGEPIRIFVVNCGPNVWSSFHVVGTIFDKAYLNANPENVLYGLQCVNVGPGDSACVEFTLEEPGEYVAVNHAFGHAAHGAIAILQAE